MTTRKIISIGAHSNLTEATIFNGSEVVEYLKQCDWHLPSESFTKIAPDEYCLVDNPSIMPDMNVVDEQRTRERVAAKTAELEEQRKRECRAAIMSVIPAAVVTMALTYLMTPAKSWDYVDVLTFIITSFFFFPVVELLFTLVIELKRECCD